jgi:hypothetical protein
MVNQTAFIESVVVNDTLMMSLTTTDSTKAAKILNAMGLNAWDVAASLASFHEHGGHCDCEILFNVNA